VPKDSGFPCGALDPDPAGHRLLAPWPTRRLRPSNPGNCDRLVAVVTLNVLWIKQPEYGSAVDGHPASDDHPWKKLDLFVGNRHYLSNDVQRTALWQGVCGLFRPRTADGTSVGNLTRAICRKRCSSCRIVEGHEPVGTTGGENYGVLARIPVLVKVTRMGLQELIKECLPMEKVRHDPIRSFP